MSLSSSYAISPWLTCYTSRPDASLRIFCFPHGGGGPHIYRQWADELPEDIEVYALHLPGRGSRRTEAPITDMDVLAPKIVEALQTYLDKPFAFFGHSVGALIAFEVTRQMRNSGRSLPLRLCVSAHKAPHHAEEKTAMYTLPDEELVEIISRLGLVPDDALENEELLQFILPPIKADFQLSETYQHREDVALPIPITTMGGQQDNLVSEQDLDAWQHYSSVDCQTMLYDGGHFYTENLRDTLLEDLTHLLRNDLKTLPQSIMEGEKAPYPEQCLHELFRTQAKRTPDRLAVADVNRQLSFKELDEITDVLAQYLQHLGVEVDSIVGIYMESCVEFVVAYLAILKASGAYMPLETAYPQKLLEKVLTTSAPVAVLTKAAVSDNLPAEWKNSNRVLCMDSGWEKKLQQLSLPPLDKECELPTIDSLAYCVMTSGTTGEPKGILCPHRGAVNSYYWRYTHVPYKDDEREACNIFLVWEVIRPILQGYPSFVIPDDIIYDPKNLIAFLEKYRITRVLFTPSLLEQVLNTTGLDLQNRLSHLQIIWLNGEVVPTALQARFFAQLPEVRLLNDYSISECHDVCTHDLADLDPVLSPKYASLGLPMSNVKIYLLDEELRPVPRGMTAEIYVGGDSLARGYLNQPQKTAERFITDPLSKDDSRLFRTGDLGMILPNGHLEVKGRVEYMIKLRGYSIVLGAVETAIVEYPEVNTAAVITSDNPETGQPESLIAYIVQNRNLDEAALVKELRIHLKKRLPHYAIPAIFITLKEMPLHASGKLDRKRLPPPPRTQVSSSPERRAAEHTTLEQTIIDVWEEILQVKASHPEDNFFDLGGHSLLAIRMTEALSQRLGVDISVVDTFEHPTVKALAEFLAPQAAAGQSSLQMHPPATKAKESGIESSDIAIIGMACRFPGAHNVDQFWENLQQGVCSVRELSEEELTARGIPASVFGSKDYRRIGALLDNVEQFEPRFWGLSKKEAGLMDPQHRLFLESCYHALEDAGYAPGSNGGRTGVFGGSYSPTYLLYYLQGGGMTDPTDPAEFHLTETGNDKDYIATRVSYLLNLRGPSITVQTSCSTAAAVVATACQSLLSGQCDTAIAGASSITFPQGGYQYVEGHINSHDGKVRAFDAGSSGTILGDGVGVIVLKRLADAIEAGDSISAVIKGFSVNNDGNAKAGYSAPSVQGQKEMIQLAQDMAGVEADTISYVEAHGTGTLIGDPIEVRALTEVFRRTTDQKGFCALGSVKPNIGHSNIAAGMAGLIKTALCLKHKQLVPLINFTKPNPAIHIEKSPFFINTNLQEWTSPLQTPRRAGVTCLGIGGTNCHFVLEEPPTSPAQDDDKRPYQLLTLGAKSEKSLERSRLNFIDYLTRNPNTNLADLAYTLHTGRDAFDHRLAVACSDTDSAIDKLKAAQAGKTLGNPVKLVFMFPGQGSQHAMMGHGLYQKETIFRHYFDQCAEILQPLLDTDIRQLIFAPQGTPEAQQAQGFAYYIQPAIFSLQYSLAKTLMAWGIIPDALIGHSIGEYTAACISGIMSLEDTLKLITARSFAMEEAEEGAMLSVNLTAEEANTYIANDSMLSLAVINSAKDVVLSGPENAIALAEKELTDTDTVCRRVHVARAFHSPMMDAAAARIGPTIDAISFSPPQIPLVSNASGTWLTDQQALDKGYWPTHMKKTVLFADNLHTILDNSPDVLLEVGSHTILRQLAVKIINQHGPEKKPHVLSCLQHPKDKTPDIESFNEALAQLWLAGVAPDWHAYHSGQPHRRMPLPVYPFDGQTCWKDNRHRQWGNQENHSLKMVPAAHSTSAAKITDIAEWGYIPSWSRSIAPQLQLQIETEPQRVSPVRWLLFMEDDSNSGSKLSARLAKKLEALGDTVIRVYKSYQPLHRDHNGRYYLDAHQPDDYHLLLKQLESGNCYPERIVDFWTLTGDNSEQACTLADTYYHALPLAQALTAQKHLKTVDIWLVTDKTVQVNQERTIPIKSTIFGPALVLPQENPNLACRLLDVEVAEKSSDAGIEELALQLMQECRALCPDLEPVIAYRGLHRWVQRYEPVALSQTIKDDSGRLRRGGIYIITGGMGRIGGTLAKHLARLKAKLVLTVRHDFPGRYHWEELAEDRETAPKMQKAVKSLLQLENAGAEVMVMRTEMSRPDEVKRLLLATVQRFGGIDGIFHAAGLAHLKYLPEMNYKISESEFAPKITGLYNLEQAIAECLRLTDKAPDFVFLFSSLASILGGYSMTAYTAANRVMDSFAQKNSGENGVAWITANWDDWDFDYTKEQVAAYEKTTARFAMSPEEGIETLERILAVPSAVQILVSTRPLAPRIVQWLHQQAMVSSPADISKACALTPTEAAVRRTNAEATQKQQSDSGLEETAAITRSPKKKKNDTGLEETVLEVYRHLLESPDMQAEDNFFHVGGDSLLAGQILLKLRQSLPDKGNALKLSSIFDYPSVREMTAWLVGQQE